MAANTQLLCFTEKDEPDCNLECGANQYCALTLIANFPIKTCTCMEGYIPLSRQECAGNHRNFMALSYPSPPEM